MPVMDCPNCDGTGYTQDAAGALMGTVTATGPCAGVIEPKCERVVLPVIKCECLNGANITCDPDPNDLTANTCKKEE